MTSSDREAMSIPSHGLPVEDVLEVIETYAASDSDPVRYLAAGSPFATGRPSVEEVARKAALRFWDANAMYRRYFPSIERMENELLGMTADLLNAPPGFGGAVTSGGSESILLAVKAARDGTRATRNPDADVLVLPETAHPAFWKAAEFLDLTVRSVPLVTDLGLDVAAYERSLDDDVVLAVHSSPSFVLGSIDPIEELASACEREGIPCHVDGCVGGFALPWLSRLGMELPAFDFRVSGVISMSADLHKYGYAPRGASVVLTRDQAWSEYHTFRYGDPPRPPGWYSTPSIAGSRPASAVAAAWAVMMHLGEEGYLGMARETQRTCAKFWETLTRAGVDLLGDPVWSLFTFSLGEGGELTSQLASGLRARSWLVHEDVFPRPLIRMMMAPGQFEWVDEYLADLEAVVQMIREGRDFDDGSNAAYT